MDPELPSAEDMSVNGEVIIPSAETTYVDVEVIKPSVENISVNAEVMDPSVETISVKDKVINSVGNENSQIKNGVMKKPEAAQAPPASAHKDVVKKSYASIVSFLLFSCSLLPPLIAVYRKCPFTRVRHGGCPLP